MEVATAHHAIVQVLLTHCCFKVSGQKDDFLCFIAVDAWQMARKTPEVRDDPSRHSPLKRRVLLAKLLLESDPDWLVEKASIIEFLQAFRVLRKAEFYGPLLEDTKRMALLDGEDALALRAFTKSEPSQREARKHSKNPMGRNFHQFQHQSEAF